MLSHCAFLDTKYSVLRADVMLVGSVSSNSVKRRVVREFCQLRQLPSPEFVSLSRDMGVSDLRDSFDMRGGSLVLTPGPVWRAAERGRILVLDGLNKADINVLPLMNDLLENRSMPLADGRLLIAAKAFDAVDVARRSRFARCSEHFAVVGLALPVPPLTNVGTTIDPPVRSRMLARYVESLALDADLCDHVPDSVASPAVWKAVCSFAAALREHQIASAAFADDTLSLEQMTALSVALERADDDWMSLLGRMMPRAAAQSDAVRIAGERFLASVAKPVTPRRLAPLPASLASTPSFDTALRQMLTDHGCDRDLLLVGDTAKTTLIAAFAQQVGGAVDTIHFHDQINSRELLMLRTADAGETGWQLGAIARAAVDGRIVVLDGIDHLPPAQFCGMLSSLSERRVLLPDGTVLLAASEFDRLTDTTGFLRIAPTFRIIATASKATAVSLESLELFSLIAASVDVAAVLARCGASPAVCDALLQSQAAPALKLKLRQLVNCARRAALAAPDEQLAVLRGALERDLLLDLLPLDRRAEVAKALDALRLPPSSGATLPAAAATVASSAFAASLDAVRSAHAELIPNVGANFVPVAEHVASQTEMARDLVAGLHLLLLGPPGTGKNFITDVLLTQLRWPRVYVSLTSESSVASLLQQPRVVAGSLVADDAPLVVAARAGCVLIVDEADKSRASATLSFLRGLIDGSGVDLGDGRRLVPASLATGRADEVLIHPLFRIVMLANPPDFPFHGSSLETVRHLFATHVIAPMGLEAETQLLQSVAPSVPAATIASIARAFKELRELVAKGLLVHPYSSREALAVCRHLEARGPTALLPALESAFVHEMWDSGARAVIRGALLKAGLRVDLAPGVGERGFLQPGGGLLVGTRPVSERDLTGPYNGPKAGKVDETGAPHVGGNTWMGGSGGRDTAGLGGAGGPWREDSGNPVHQVTDEVKRAVPQSVQDAAREMGQAELKRRLAALSMTAFDMNSYAHFRSTDVVAGIAQIRALLASLKAFRKGVDDDDEDDDEDGDNKSHRRGWLKNQTDGEIDTQRIADGLAGDARMFRRKSRLPDDKHWLNTAVNDSAEGGGSGGGGDGGDGASGKKDGVTHMRVLLDLSASMYRFNGYDQRLTKLLQSTAMLLEGFQGVPATLVDGSKQRKLTFDLSGHSGDGPFHDLKRTAADDLPQHWRIIQTCATLPQFVYAGDHTLEAGALALTQLKPTMKAGDRGVVVLISDANMRRYGIRADDVREVVDRAAAQSVALHFVFIADFDREANALAGALPGRAHVCRDVAALPDALRAILLSAMR